MKPLLVLLTTFLIAAIATKLFSSHVDFILAARIGMSVMMLFTAIAHFAFAKGMAMMIPDFIPYQLQLVYITGIIEILSAPGLLILVTRSLTAWLLIVFFILIIPANINAANKNINYQKGTFDGSGPAYLWFRIPLQIFFIAWVYMSCLYF